MSAGIGQHPLCSPIAASAEPRAPASLPVRPPKPIGRPEARHALSGTLASGNSAGTSAGTSADHPPSLLRAPRHAHQITFVSMLYGVSRTFRNDASGHRLPSRSTHSLRVCCILRCLRSLSSLPARLARPFPGPMSGRFSSFLLKRPLVRSAHRSPLVFAFSLPHLSIAHVSYVLSPSCHTYIHECTYNYTIPHITLAPALLKRGFGRIS